MKTEIKMPTINVNDDTVSLLKWLVADGESVTEGQPICEVETSKAIEDVLSPGPGVLHISCDRGDVRTGTIIAYLDANASSQAFEHQAVPNVSPIHHASPTGYPEPRFTQAAIALLERRNIEPSVFTGRGLVRSTDVLDYLGEKRQAFTEMAKTVLLSQVDDRLSPSQRRAKFFSNYSSSEFSKDNVHPDRSDSSLPIPKRKQEEIRVLSEGHLNALPSALTQIVDVTGLQSYLVSLSHDVTITISSIVTYEVARLLTIYKEFNASFTNQGIKYHEKINIGMAIDGEHGLKVAAIQSANEKNIIEIAADMETLLQSYLDDRLPVNTLTSSTFNISDLTSFGVPWFIPLISKNQSAILGIGMLQTQDRDSLSMTLTFDHRVTEGKRAAEFLQELKSRITSYVFAAGQDDQSRSKVLWQKPTCTRCFRTTDEIPGDSRFFVQVVDESGVNALMCKQCIEGW